MIGAKKNRVLEHRPHPNNQPPKRQNIVEELCGHTPYLLAQDNN